MTAKTMDFTIQVTYPPNADERDFDRMLNELLDTATKYGLGVDGYYSEAEE